MDISNSIGIDMVLGLCTPTSASQSTCQTPLDFILKGHLESGEAIGLDLISVYSLSALVMQWLCTIGSATTSVFFQKRFLHIDGWYWLDIDIIWYEYNMRYEMKLYDLIWVDDCDIDWYDMFRIY